MKTIKGIIFDVDGVIINTEFIHFIAYQKVLKTYGFDLTFDGYKKNLSGKTVEGGISTIQKNTDISLDISEIKKEKIALTKKDFQSQLAFYKDSIDFIYKISKGGMRVRDIGIVSPDPTLAVATGLERTLIDEMFVKEHSLKNIFSVVTVAEDYKRGKPDPECYSSTAHKMGIDVDCLIGIEDSPSGIKALNQANIFSIGLTNTHTADELKNANIVTDSLINLLN